MNLVGIMIAIVSGALMSIQGVFNEGVSKQAGVWASSVFVQFTALLVCFAAFLFTLRENSLSALFGVDHKYMLLGGVFGAAITYTVIRSIASLGPAKAVMIIVVSQLITAYLIELFGAFEVEKVGFEMKKLVGVALAVGGIVIFKWK